MEFSDSVDVDSLIQAVKAAVRESGVSSENTGGDLRVESIQLILRTVATKAGGGRLELRVPVIGMAIKAGAKLTRHDTHTIDITLVPPSPPSAAVTGPGSVQLALVQAIRTIRLAMISAAAGYDPWGIADGQVDLEFVVTKEGVISLGADGELSHDVSHTLRLRLGPRPAGHPLAVPAQAKASEDSAPTIGQGN